MTARHDADVLDSHELTALLGGAPWRRVAVLGDSVAAGVREPHPGFRDLSWVDRVTEALRAHAGEEFALADLARRDLLAGEVRELQLPEALAFRPDLAILAAGGNDALRRSFDPAAVRAELEGIVRPLRRAGADVLMVELLDLVRAGLVPAEHRASVDRRFRDLAAVTREVAAQHGAILVGLRRHPAGADPDMWSSDRLHLNARGHAVVGTETARVLAAASVMRVAA